MAMPSKDLSWVRCRAHCSTIRSSKQGSIVSMSVVPTQSCLSLSKSPPPTLQPCLSSALESSSRRYALAPSGPGHGPPLPFGRVPQ